MTLLDNLVRKTVLRTARDFDDPNSPLLISNVHHCYVYILACLAEITIKDCTDSIIVTGASRAVIIENCSRCIIMSISKALKIQGSSELTIHACVNTRPVLTMGNSNVILAPYNTYYSQLDAHIQELDIKTGLKENLWSSPMDYNRARSVSLLMANKMPNTALLEEKVHTYTIMNPDEFTPFSVPFNLPGTTKANPIELPPEYTQSLQRRAASIVELKKLIDSVPEPQKDELKKMIEEKFRLKISIGGVPLTQEMWKDLLALPFSPLEKVGGQNESIGVHILRSIRLHLYKTRNGRSPLSQLLKDIPMWMQVNREKKKDGVRPDQCISKGVLSPDLLVALLRIVEGKAPCQEDPYAGKNMKGKQKKENEKAVKKKEGKGKEKANEKKKKDEKVNKEKEKDTKRKRDSDFEDSDFEDSNMAKANKKMRDESEEEEEEDEGEEDEEEDDE